jgi:transcriptional antiterminator RfaH
MLQWYALFTKPHKERQVESALHDRGIEVYLPAIQSPGRKPQRGCPFFPRYLFAKFDVEQNGVNALCYIPGLSNVVMFGGLPARVDERTIAALHERLSTETAYEIRGEPIKRGDLVKITKGPFANLEALFDSRLTAAGRVRVLVQLLQRWTAIDIQASNVSRAPHSLRHSRSFEPTFQPHYLSCIG